MAPDTRRALSLFWKDLGMQLLSLVVVPIACCQVRIGADGKNRLPEWASDWDELDYGCDGDGDATSGWQGPRNANGHQTEYLWRVRFLLRNRTNTYAKKTLGFRTDEIVSIRHDGDPLTCNKRGVSGPGHSGAVRIDVTLKDGRTFFQEYEVQQSKRFPTLCTRRNVGWKLTDVLDWYRAEGKLTGNPNQREYVQFVFIPYSISSFTQ